ncbi:MAG: 16S rRNA (cytosine(967)-C(5))-methyltransferase RsmB [Clostridiales bacterium]|nr:16S rRNA (cytosine(967)-C(5))-methyltransferase RsmB [Clostridiales bacterium]
MDKVRYTALKILREVNEKGSYINIALKKHLERGGLDNRDASFVSRLVYGTLENQEAIDKIIKDFVGKKNMNPWIKNIIRLGSYQILFMERVPDSAACNESVNLCMKIGLGSLKGFVNGVLRNISRKKGSLKILSDDSTDMEALSARHGFPLWLTRMWGMEYGQESAQAIVKASHDPGWITIRINTRRTYKEELVEKLKESGVVVQDGHYCENALRIHGIGNIGQNQMFRKGLFTVQGESSILVCRALDPKPGERIMDVCSAPGGKALYIAELMDMMGKVYAFDIHQHRVDLIKVNKNRLGAAIISEGMKDARIFDPGFEGKMDRILIDAPCTGWGIIHKKPDIKLRIKEENLNSLYDLQWEILKTCSRYVKEGGIMVYSTCTINPVENHGIIDRFLIEHPEFALEDLGNMLPNGLKQAAIKGGMIQLIPGRDMIDGFFIARLRRNGL